MIHALQVTGKVLLRKMPPRALWYVVANKFSNLLRNGNPKYRFNLLYLENPDPWNYLCSEYEHCKYDHTLACILKWRKASKYALEIGCSIGVFSKLLSIHFDEITAMDFSKEALRAAASYNNSIKNIRFVHGDLRYTKHDRRFDTIICGEILGYIPEKHAEKVCQQLETFLASHGIIVTVLCIKGGDARLWGQILSRQFALVHRETVEKGAGSYEIVVFSQLTTSSSAPRGSARNTWSATRPSASAMPPRYVIDDRVSRSGRAVK